MDSFHLEIALYLSVERSCATCDFRRDQTRQIACNGFNVALIDDSTRSDFIADLSQQLYL